MTSFLISIEEGLGNAIQAMPMILAIKKYYPDSVIDVLCTERSREFLQEQSAINGLFDLRTANLTKTYNFGFVLQYTSGASVPLVRKHTEGRCYFNLNPIWAQESEAQCNMDLLKNIGITERVEDFKVEFEGHPKAMVAFHFGCFPSPVWKTREWPDKYWVDLLKRISADGFLPILIAGNDAEVAKTKEVVGLADVIHMTVFKSSLKIVAGALKQCKVLLSLDSGIMHLAGTQDILQISLWGPTSHIKSQPLNPKNHIMRSDHNCQMCYPLNRPLWQSCKDNKCMQKLTPEMVFNKFKEIIKNERN